MRIQACPSLTWWHCSCALFSDEEDATAQVGRERHLPAHSVQLRVRAGGAHRPGADGMSARLQVGGMVAGPMDATLRGMVQDVSFFLVLLGWLGACLALASLLSLQA
jgi:hypothetical protein